MKSFLSFLRQLDSSNDVLCDQTASRRQFQLFRFLSQASRPIDRTKDTLSSRQNSKSIDLNSGRIDARDLQDDRPESSAVEKINWRQRYSQFGAAGLISTAACFWQSTSVMAAPLSCSSIYADVNGGTAIYSINTATAAITPAATLPVNSNIGIAAINVGGVPTVYSDSATASIHLNYTNGTTTGNNTAAIFTNPYGGGLGADTAGRLFYIGNNGTTQSLMRFATTTSAATNIGTITSAIANDTVWKNLVPGDMMSDANGRLYYFGADASFAGSGINNYLYYIDASMIAHRLGFYNSTQQGIGVAFDPSGAMYTLNRNLLYKIDLTGGFSATLIGDTGNSSLIDMASCALPTMNPSVSGTKTVRDVTTGENPATIVNTNDILEYNIVIKNTGNLPSDGSKLIDTIPPGSSYVASSTKLCNATGVTCATVADVSGSGPFVGSGMLVNTLGQSSGIVLAGAANNAIVKFQVKVTSTGNPASIVNTGQTSYPTVNGGIVTTNTPNTTATSIPVATNSSDYGDAPDGSAGTATGNYRTTASDNGPSHVIVAGLKLGATAPDADNGLQQNTAATADGADEDAFTSLPNVPTTGSYSLTNVPVTNTTGSAATLHAWVDFNNNGSFEAGEYTSATVANNATTANLSWTVPAGTVAGSTYARFRLTTQALTDNAATTVEDERSIGAASNGEVEDYTVSIVAAPTTILPIITTPGICSIPGANRFARTNWTSPFTSGNSYPFTTNISGYTNSVIYTKISGTYNVQPYVYPQGYAYTANSGPLNNVSIPFMGFAFVPIAGVDGINSYSFATPLTSSDAILISDIDNTEEIELRFYDASGNILSTSGWTGESIKATSPNPTATVGSNYIRIFNPAGGSANLADPTWMLIPPAGQNVARVELSQINRATSGDYAITFVHGDCPSASTASISGTVFEDPNYGGGAGRNLATLTTSPRDGATVELYKSDGTYISNTITASGGKYTFTNLASGDYKVRVVNSTITSSRGTGSLYPVQTFRTDAGVTAGTVTAVTDYVGGEKPAEIDAPANTTATLATLNAVTNQEVQSLSTVKVSSSNVSGVDFGYNFDTIVNTNDSGQGSLRQFITNSNTLTNAGLAQVGQTAGKEVSIFMIPNGNVHPGLRAGVTSGINGAGGNANAAVISLTSNFTITANDTHLDATTQTTNVGDLNTGSVGTGGTVGVDGLALSSIPKPEVVLNFQNVPANSNAIKISGGNTVLKGFASYGYRSTNNLATLLKAAIVIDAAVPNTSPATITQLLGGTTANGSDPVVSTFDVGYTLQTAGAANISNNYLAYNSDAITFENTNGTSVNFINNEVAYNGPKDNNGSNASGIYADQIETVEGTKNITLRGNLIRNSSKPNYANAQGQGIQISYSSFITLENNTFSDNNVYAINASSSDTVIQKNIITGTKSTGLGQGSGIAVYYGGPLNTGLRNRISQNSIYQNAKLGIDHQVDGVTPNDGLLNAVKPNNGMDYPIITSSVLSGGNLTVKGFVGTGAVTSSIFVGATLEFFVADDDLNNNGPVIISDGKSKPHGEGKTYIGGSTAGNLCVSDITGAFNCTFPNVSAIVTDPKLITATATDVLGNTSEFSSVVSSAQLLIVKRITSIKDSETGASTNFNAFVDDTASTTKTNDNNCGWPTALGISGTPGSCTNIYTIGKIDGGIVKPGDEIEYTIYYLNVGGNKASRARVCDKLNPNLAFQTQSGNGIGISKSGGTIQYLTNSADSDAGQITTPALATSCNIVNTGTNEVVIVDVANPTNPLLGSTGVGTTNSYGYVRFKVKVK